MKYIPKTVKGQENLDKIINSAIEIIASKGFNNASVNEITFKAGVSYGLFYLYFENKDELLVQLIKRLNHDMRRFLQIKTSEIDNRIIKEQQGFRTFFEWVFKNKFFFQILIEAQTSNIDIYKWHYTTLEGRYASGLKEAMERGQIIKTDEHNLAYSLMGIADFLARRFILWENREINDDVLKSVDQMLEQLLNPERR
jgi:AcrR family transcriptional regulator